MDLGRRARRVGAALIGPVVVAGLVVAVLRRFVFAGLATPGDMVRYWLPMQCFLGRSLRGGHIPLWNPFVLGGQPFAADPQSGWLQILPTALFTTMPCDAAMVVEVVVQPIIGGLAIYAFLRSERLSRAAATVGALAFALVVAGTRLPVAVRFPGALAWTAVSLAVASRALRARTLPGCLVLVLATAVTWGQVAASHLTVGLLIGTGAVGAYVAARLVAAVRDGSMRWRAALGRATLLAAALPLVNAAYLLPRVAFAPQTSVGLGYERLHDLSQQLLGKASPPFPGFAAAPTWPLNFATFPGIYVGAVVLSMVFAAWWSPRLRPLAVAFSALGALCYVLSLHVVGAHVPDALRHILIVDQYLHEPDWVGFGVLVAIPVLAAAGIDAWVEAPTIRTRVIMTLPAVGAWVVLPFVMGASARRMAMVLVGGTFVGAVLLLLARRRSFLWLLPALLSVELFGTIVFGRPRLTFDPAPKLLLQLRQPTVQPESYIRAPPLARVLRVRLGNDRYVSLGPSSGQRWSQQAALQNNESMVFGLNNIGGYQAVQLARYWLFVRHVQHDHMKYNYAVFSTADPTAMDLLDVRYVIAHGEADPGPRARLVERAGSWTLYQRSPVPGRASVVPAWRVVRSPAAALDDVASPRFDPDRVVVLERPPRFSGGSGGADSTGAPPSVRPIARYRSTGEQSAQVTVFATRPSVVLVRTPYAQGWQATVDGHPENVVPADYVDQAVAVPSGRHVIELAYRDSTIALGAGVTAVSTVGLLLAATALWVVSRRRPRLPVSQSELRPDDVSV